jgi:hypothetical protein
LDLCASCDFYAFGIYPVQEILLTVVVGFGPAAPRTSSSVVLGQVGRIERKIKPNKE